MKVLNEQKTDNLRFCSHGNTHQGQKQADIPNRVAATSFPREVPRLRVKNAEFRRIILLFRGIHLYQVLYSAAIKIF